MVAKSFIFGGNTGETPETLKRKRAMAEALAQSRMPKNVGEGLTEVGNAIAYRMALADLASGEAMGQQKASAAMSPILSAFGGGTAAFPPAPAPAGGSAPMTSDITSPNPAVAAMLKGEQVQGTAGNARAVDRASMAGYSGDVVQNVPNSTGAIVAKKLQSDFNLTPEAAAGFAGNLAHESGNFNTLQEINPTVKGSRGGYGWAQWTGPRRRQFESWAAQNNLDPSSPEANYGFLKTELQGNEGAVLKALQGVSDPAQAAQIVSNQFLRPGVPHMDSRISRTKAILEAMNSGGQTQIASAPNAYAPEMMAAAQPQQQNVQVASLDPSIGMPQQMYVGKVDGGSIGTAVQDAPAQGAIRKAIGGMAGEQAPQQMAQNVPPMPQNEATSLDRIIGTDTPLGPQLQQPQLNVGMIMQALQEPFLNEGQRSMLNGLLQHEMQKQDPAYQLQQQQAQIGLQKDQLELKNLQNPQPKWDIVTGKDGSVFRIDPQTGKHETIYGPQAEPVKPTADIQEYEYAKGQGFQGTFQEFQLAVKKAGASQVNIDQKAEGAFDKKLAEQQATTFDTMATDGMNAKSELAVIGELNTLLQGQGGTLTGMSGALARYGIGGEGVGDLQAADALINKLIPSQRQAGSGSMSDRDVEMFKASLPSLWKTPDGNKTILNTMTGLAQYKQAQGDIAQRVMIGEIDRQTAVKLLRELPNPLAAFGEQDKKTALPTGPAGNLKSKYGLE